MSLNDTAMYSKLGVGGTFWCVVVVFSALKNWFKNKLTIYCKNELLIFIYIAWKYISFRT